ncbi:MAG: DAK2 domain-containing protein, partial [Ureaplasma sp.]|nr:DAK2 domain-containing protein [Ureaplasma sp.]
MRKISLDAFLDMLKVGTNSLACEYEYINELNVFPIPDGDTGINMKTTSLGAFNSISLSKFNDLYHLGNEYKKQLLFNARGNSGVIFSQIMKGFCESFNENQIELTIEDLQKSFHNAKECAYDSVYNPIEGTILTVIRMIDEAINNKKYNSVEELFLDVVKYGEEALLQTREILPELKRVNVVDSGGYGLMSFLKGMNALIQGNVEEYLKDLKEKNKNSETADFQSFEDIHDGSEFGYCSEVIIRLSENIDPSKKSRKKAFDKVEFTKDLEKFGNSIVCVQIDDIVKVHVHTVK